MQILNLEFCKGQNQWLKGVKYDKEHVLVMDDADLKLELDMLSF